VTSLISRIRATNRRAFFLAIVNILFWSGLIAVFMLMKR